MALLKDGSNQGSNHAYFLIALSKQLVSHAWMCFNAYFLELSMNIFLLLLQTWKYSST